MPVSSSSLRDMAWNWDEGGCRTRRWRAMPESIWGGGEKMTVDTETWCFAPPLCLSTSHFLLFLKRSWSHFGNNENLPNLDHWLRVCIVQLPAGTQHSFCLSVLQRNWNIERQAVVFPPTFDMCSSTAGFTLIDPQEIKAAQMTFHRPRRVWLPEIFTVVYDFYLCTDLLIGRRLAAGSSGYLSGYIIESSPFCRVILSLSQHRQRWTVGRRTFTDKSIYNVFWIKSTMYHKLLRCPDKKCVHLSNISLGLAANASLADCLRFRKYQCGLTAHEDQRCISWAKGVLVRP